MPGPRVHQAAEPVDGLDCDWVRGCPTSTSLDLLLRQVTSPVHSSKPCPERPKDIDLWIEAGPGRVLTRAGRRVGFRRRWSRSKWAASPSAGLLRAAGAAYALGVPLNPAILPTAVEPSLSDQLAASVLCQPLRAGPHTGWARRGSGSSRRHRSGCRVTIEAGPLTDSVARAGAVPSGGEGRITDQVGER